MAMHTATYPFHINILKNEFDQRASRNQGYSLRAYARDLGLSPAALSCLLNLKKGISEQKAQDIASRLGLSKSETQQFLLSVVAEHSRSPGRRREALEKISNQSLRNHRQKKIETSAFSTIQNWYSLALLELMELEQCTHKTEWFAEKLQLSPVLIKNALEKLKDAGLVEFKNNKYIALTEESTTEEDIPSAEIKNYHAEMMKQAEGSLYKGHIDEREFINMTMAFPVAEMDEAKQMIRDFQIAFAERFYHQTKKKKNSVYQLSVQFFRIDKKKDNLR